MEDNQNTSNNNNRLNRRDLLKGLATVPVIGAFAYGVWRKKKLDHYRNNQLSNELNMSRTEPADPKMTWDGEPMRLGIIGYGIRGKQLLKAAGFAMPEQVQAWKEQAEKDSNNKRYIEFKEQDDLNIKITGVCDLFS